MPTFPRLLGLLVASSGAAALSYEMLWIRALGLHFGTTTPAVTTVVATFMAGLGLGNLLFGQRADQSARPFALYRTLEVSIAITGLGVSLFLLRGGSWLDGLARLCSRAGSLSTVATASVFGLLMLAPATAIGGTLPVLSRALSRHAHAGRTLGLLYACNTLGAIAGALVPDFLLIPRHGLTFSACTAAAINASVALAVHRYVEARDEPLAAFTTEVAVTNIAPPSTALVISASSGFCAMGLEVLWSRTLQHWAAALVTSFAVLLAVYLTALAAGALFTQRFADRSPQPLRTAAALLGLTGLLSFLPIACAPPWRSFERALWPRTDGIRRLGLVKEAIDALLHATYLESAACFVMGAAFPFLAAAWLVDGKRERERTRRPGIRTGQLLLANTFAGVLGALVMGFLCLPALGEQASYAAVALALTSIAVACAWFSPRAGVRQPSVASASITFTIVLALVIWLPNDRLQRAHFQSGGQLIAVREGSTTTAAAATRFVYGEPYYRELLTPGISMSSTRPDARRYMAVMAHAAMLTAVRPERALLICYGVGNTASALLSHAELKQLDVVDISPEVLALAPYFAADRGDDPLRDPRTRSFVDDGRHHLITHAVRYDIITAEPPPPNYAGVSNLYSREFYELAKSRLTVGGVITQWLPVFQLSDDDVRAMIAAFVAELPHTALLYGYGQQLLLLGSVAPLAIQSLRFTDQRFVHDLRANYIGAPEDLLGSLIQTDAELRRQVSGVTPLSDELPSIQYPYDDVSERALYSARFPANPKRALTWLAKPIDPTLEQRVLSAANATERALSALPALSIDPPDARERALGRALQPALDAHPEDEGLWILLGADSHRVRLAELALQRPGATELLRDRITANAKFWILQDALWVLARRAFYSRDYTRAATWLDQIVTEPNNRALHVMLKAECTAELNRARR